MGMKKKGQLQDLSRGAIAVLVFILIVSIGALILSQVQTTQTNNSIAFNTTAQGLSAIGLFGSFTSVIVLVVVAAVILALIAVAFRAFA